MTIKPLELDALAKNPKDKPYIIREKQHNKKDGTLAFKILPGGEIDGYFIYYVNGKEKLKKIGRYGKSKDGLLTLKEIRDRYLELSKKYQSGIDIKVQEVENVAKIEQERIVKEAAELKIQRQGSFQQLIDLYINHAEENLSKHYYESIKSAFSFNLQEFDTSIKANQITKSHIKSIIRPIKERNSQVMANRMRSYLSAAFNWAIELEEDDIEFRKHNIEFYIESNPVSVVKKPLKKEMPRDRFLNENEIYKFWHALDLSKINIFRVNVFKLMLATGCRLEALTGLQWNEIDWKQKLLSIPIDRSKNDKYWIIPIDGIGYEILSNNLKMNESLCFPEIKKSELLRTDGFNQASIRICHQYNIEHFTPRDLRTTFKTLAGKAGLNKDIRDRLQNHALTDVSSKHYDRYDYLKEKRQAIQIWNEYLSNIIDGTYIDDDVKDYIEKKRTKNN